MLGGAQKSESHLQEPFFPTPGVIPAKEEKISAALRALDERAERLKALYEDLAAAGLGESYEASHVRLALKAVRMIHERQRLLASGKLILLPEPSQSAADQSFLDTAQRLGEGLEKVLKSYENSTDPRKKKVFHLFDAWTRRE